MKHPLEWAATHLKKPGYFCTLQIIAGLVSANVAGILLRHHFQALGYIAADPIGYRSGESLHSVAVLARLGGDTEVAPLAGAVIGTLLTIILGAIGNRHRGCVGSAGALF